VFRENIPRCRNRADKIRSDRNRQTCNGCEIIPVEAITATVLRVFLEKLSTPSDVLNLLAGPCSRLEGSEIGADVLDVLGKLDWKNSTADVVPSCSTAACRSVPAFISGSISEPLIVAFVVSGRSHVGPDHPCIFEQGSVDFAVQDSCSLEVGAAESRSRKITSFEEDFR